MINNVLVISNEPLALENSNGRTMIQLLNKIPKDNIFQFCLKKNAGETFAKETVTITDNEAVDAFLYRKRSNHLKSNDTKKKTKRNCKNLLLRDLIWGSFRWWNKDFDNFLSNIAPFTIIFQAGDSPFMFRIASKISKKYSSDVIVFNTENYVLKRRLYSSVKKPSIWHFLLKMRLNAAFSKIVQTSKCHIFNSEYLEIEYKKKYPAIKNTHIIYNSSSLSRIERNDYVYDVCYCGNLGVGRITPIIEIAKSLYKYDKNKIMVICGKTETDQDLALIKQQKNILYKGELSYHDILEIYKNSFINVHCENVNRLDNLRAAFSTKIADCLAIGIPFLVYASRDFPFVKYLEKNNCAHIAETTQELDSFFVKAFSSSSFANRYIENSLLIANKNHNVELNANIMRDLIYECE